LKWVKVVLEFFNIVQMTELENNAANTIKKFSVTIRRRRLNKKMLRLINAM